ncbi:hypothetical protein LX32DRAFT_647769 [Colletotrichum zoysiae]|uniref:Uncharacterized protein n=1 Tax=Colletotrichum zoysiae TaxID=1216348 RepID=A0AAD9M6L8_9PEZI|nr:hypothetical protein LX32DRAFT_647769 [Colletotrichum zoysiae]
MTLGPWGNIFHRTALISGIGVLLYLESLSLSGIDTEHINASGGTAWDCFIWVSYTENWSLGVRDRNLDCDVKTLQRVREYVMHEDQRGATAALASLVKQKEEWNQGGLVETYRTIRLQIREAMWDAAMESVDENIEVLQEAINKSPWDNCSRWDYLIHKEPDESASESEDESKTTTVHSAEDEEQEMIEKEKGEERKTRRA